MDDLVLNIASESTDTGVKKSSKKGGRWTDRLKANRNAKRKARPTDEPSKTSDDRPEKRPRTSQPSAPKSAAVDAAVKQAQTQARPPGQIISSLFSSNPRVEAPAPEPIKKKPAATPSNAPLTDSSSFVGLGLDPLLASHLSSKMEIAKPTSIQSATLSAIATPANHERDLFIQSQTGSGKTLAFLLPIIQDLLPLGKLSYIDRSIGTLAIIIAPTRELAKQISEVLEALLKLRLRAENESADDADAPRLTRWMVSGLLIGGSTRTHEKAKLRKGVPILVSTPGRLLDHLQNTASFDVGKCRWLVLDEADRLMELGFEESITGIIKGLDGRRKLALKANEEGIGNDVGGWDWERQRRTILCSATIREDVQKLSGKALVNPVMIRGALADASLDSTIVPSAKTDEQFTPPSQLLQKYVVVPLKLRLVVLVALLRYLLAQAQTQKGTKIIVFLSCTDSVDFHWNLLGGLSMADDLPEGSDSDSDVETQTKPDKSLHQQVEIKSSILPDTSIFRLHGSLPTHTRLASLKQFSNKSQSGQSAILLCTSVASRGLDLPLVRAVVQYDLPTEGGATEYVHRVGRTARAGKGGEAWAVVAPSESEWVKWVEKHMQSQGKITMQGSSVENLLKLGFGGQGRESEERATEIQLSLERWVLSRTKNAELARQAFLSHMRAYSTHPTDEKHMFHVRNLHIGHLAKAFALRDAPKAVSGGGGSKRKETKRNQANGKERGTNRGDHSKVQFVFDAEKRMQDVVRSQGRLTRKGGVMADFGTSDYQIAGGYDLEKMVQKI